MSGEEQIPTAAVNAAVHAAVSALYLEPTQTRALQNALWDVLRALDPKICDLLGDNPEAAFAASFARSEADPR